MKRVLFIILLFTFTCQTTVCYGYPSQSLEKIPTKYIYSSDIIDYAEKEFDFSEYDFTTWDEFKTGVDAGWSAFNQNLGLQGAAFTALEEGLGASFLKNINSAFEKIGAGLIVLQFGIDLMTKDYKIANTNLAKSSLFFAIGKWGSRGMKLGVVGAIVVEWYLGAIAEAVFKKHDTFWLNALSWHFDKSDGAISLEGLKATFSAAQEKAMAEGKILKQEEVIDILDNFLEQEIWADQLMFLEAAYRGANKGSAGMVRASKGRLKEKKETFNNYMKGEIILPSLKAYFKQMAKDSIENKAEEMTKIFKKLITEYNREYRLVGRVIGPKDEIRGLKVIIPGFLETTTDENGKYELRFTLYAFLKSNFWQKNKGSGLQVNLEVPIKEGTKVLTRRGKIRTQHRNKGVIAVKPFQLEKSWELCIEEKIKSNQFSCDITASVLPDPSTGQHVIKEPYCSNDPFKIKIENINNFMRRYPELNRGSLPYKELDKRMGNLYSKRRDEEFRLIQEKGIEDKAQFAQGCGNCKLERQEGRTQGGEFDYWIVCWEERTRTYKMTVDAYNCGSRWDKARFNRINPEVEAVIKENRYIGAMLFLFKTLKECGYDKDYWED